jgi:hypothetical protein
MRNNFHIIFFLFFLLHSTFSTGQEVLLDMKQAVDSIEPKTGKNRAQYTHAYLAYGFILGPSDAGAATIPFSTREILYGVRHKRKLSNAFALGYDLIYKYQAFVLQQDSIKTLPNKLLNDRERMIFHYATLGFYFRTNFDKLRGNKLGKFLDIGAYGDYVFSHVLFQRNELSSGVVNRTRSTKHSYFNRFNYGANMRFGTDRFSVYAAYRLSDIFYPSLDLPEMSRLTIGLQLNLN